MAPTDFDFESLVRGEDTEPADAPEQVAQPQADSSTTEFDERMSEVERRLEVAQHYRLLLDNPLFSDPSPAGEVVESEIRNFVRERLEDLVGISTSKQKTDDVFDDEEVQVLKAIAAKLLKRPQLLESTPAPQAPRPAPALRKVSGPSVAPVPPKVNRVPASTKPKKSTPTQTQKAPEKAPSSVEQSNEDPKEGDVFTDPETGKTYKWVFNPQSDKLIKINVTPTPKNPNAVPTIKVTPQTRDQIAALSQAQAASQVAAAPVVLVK